jgi:hypothetical protein
MKESGFSNKYEFKQFKKYPSLGLGSSGRTHILQVCGPQFKPL